MAPSLIKLLCAALFASSLLLQGSGARCGLSTIRVNQQTTGERSGLDYEFRVDVTNACSFACFHSNVRLHAPAGFMSQKPVNPKRFRPDGAGTFLINDGNPIPAGTAVNFTYWWDHATYFFPAGSQASAC
ncbi:hypothetical protein Taro_007601 [Colocasia esculenta]|uniref:Uncharacterized protein n=1 Tax=Colocasia esculenta TaxID=4460 RepID=A0A843U0Y9_COLES|nr:hypothetical protein [Colocasia esculenta]